jgi:hypothetical protein
MELKRLACLFLACAGLSPVRPAYAQDARLKDLETIWEAQRQEVATAHIRCRSFRNANINSISHEEVVQAIKSADLVRNPDGLKTVIDRLSSKYLTNPKPWSVIDYYFSGPKVKEDVLGTQVFVFDGQNSIELDPANHQVRLFKPGDYTAYIRKLSDFRRVPRNSNYRIEHVGSGLLELHDESLALERFFVEAGTGLLREFRSEHGKGKVGRATIQEHFVTYPGGITFPALVVKADYGATGLHSIDLTLVEEASFNQELPPDTFKVGIPAGTNVFDERKGHLATLTQVPATGDVVRLADNPGTTSDTTEGGWFKRNRWLIAGPLVAAVTAFVVVSLWRRKAQAER